jgi:hypothetical protein
VSAASALARGRAAAEALMVDTCTIERPTARTPDRKNGVVTTTYTTVYTGQCKLNYVGDVTPGPQQREVAEAHLAVLTPTLHLPMSATGLAEGDRVTITASQHDPELVGKVLRLQGPHHGSFQTARRLMCTEVTS